jgi:putative two-component system response regulator
MTLFLARIRNHIALKVFSDRFREREEELSTQMLNKSAELASVQASMISALTVMACARDIETGKHILRTQLYIKCLASQLRTHARFSAIIDDKYIEHLYRSAPLHDIGKISIPDRILLKPGRLTPEEFEVMKEHPLLGLEAIKKIQATAADNLEFLNMGKEISYSHHEKWDGSGYPQGLAGEEIPLSARLMALVDVYDAITSRRPYKEPMSHSVAVDLISSSRGTHFDPDIVDAFYKISAIFEKISLLHMDSEEDIASEYEED